MRHLILLSLCLIAFTPEKAWSGTKVIKVLSYNIAGLPFKQRNGSRYDRIGEILAERRANGNEPDIVLLQEAFIKKSKRIIKKANYPHLYKGPKKRFFKGKLFSSGLYVLSNHEFIVTNKREYKGKKHCTSWDCFANKGLTHTRLKIQGIPFPIEIMNTHMQANAGGTARAVSRSRAKQVNIVKDFMNQYIDPHLPLIFAGDFNLKPNHPKKPSYSVLMNNTKSINAGEYCLNNEDLCFIDLDTPREEVWVDTNDHHLFRSSGNVIIEPIYLTRNFQEIHDGDNLSDHLGYEVHYRITW